jgi:hypothetical protein
MHCHRGRFEEQATPHSQLLLSKIRCSKPKALELSWPVTRGLEWLIETPNARPRDDRRLGEWQWKA